MGAFELLFGERNNDNQLSYITNTPLLTPKNHKLSANCCDFINKCLIIDDKQRPSAKELLEHEWFTQNIKPCTLKQKWPWLVVVDGIHSVHSDEEKQSTQNNKAKKHNKRTSFGDIKQNQYYNEDLLFMITALIIHYSKQNVNLENESHKNLHRRISYAKIENNSGNQVFTDSQRVANIAKYALCPKEMVIERIRVTVAYIKSQLNKADVSRIDS